MTTQTVTIEGTKWLTSNGSHGNTFQQAKLRAEWRQRAYLASRAARLTPITGTVHLTVTVHRTTNAHSDATNIATTAKTIIDGALVESGIITDDCDCVVLSTTFVRGPKRGTPTVTLRIETAPTPTGTTNRANHTNHKGNQP